MLAQVQANINYKFIWSPAKTVVKIRQCSVCINT